MNDVDQVPREERAGKKEADDEISLVDFFVVLLKYRRMIIAVVVLGLVAAAAYYVYRGMNRASQPPQPSAPVGEYEGRMTLVINPRLGRSGADKFPGWFGSRELLDTALEEAGLTGRRYDSFIVTDNQNDGVDIVLEPGPGDEESVEKLFSILLDKAEAMAAAYYAQYAEDLIAYFESRPETGGEYSVQDYIRCQWARDLLSGDDTVIKTLYPPVVSGEFKITDSPSGFSGSALVPSVIIVFAALFFAVFLAFVLNAVKNISADSDVMEKIRGALGKKDRDAT
jgi:hypothetical protein